MKKSIVALAVIVTLSANVFAGTEEPVNGKWGGTNINVYKLSNYLELTANQSQEVANICEYFTEQMEQATNAKKNKEEKLRKAVYGNLKLMKQTLTQEQYTKYTRVLNSTLNNKGIEVK